MSKPFKAIGKVFKKVMKSTVGKIIIGALMIGAIVLTAGAAIPALGAAMGMAGGIGGTLASIGITGTLGSVLSGAIGMGAIGAVTSGAIGGLTGQSIFKSATKGFLVGAATGGVLGGAGALSAAGGGIFGGGTAAARQRGSRNNAALGSALTGVPVRTGAASSRMEQRRWRYNAIAAPSQAAKLSPVCALALAVRTARHGNTAAAGWQWPAWHACPEPCHRWRPDAVWLRFRQGGRGRGKEEAAGSSMRLTDRLELWGTRICIATESPWSPPAKSHGTTMPRSISGEGMDSGTAPAVHGQPACRPAIPDR